MPGIEIKGQSKRANYRHGGRTGKFGGGRTNLLEQLGRVEGERSNPNRRAEISRVHGELNRGYAKGGRAGYAIGSIVKGGKQIIKKIISKIKKKPKDRWETLDTKVEGKMIPGPQKGKYGAIDEVMENIQKQKKKGVVNPHYTGKAEGGRTGYALGSVVKAAAKKIKKHIDTKKGKFPETESLVHQKGPYVGDVGSERPGIKRRAGPRAGKGKSKGWVLVNPERPKAGPREAPSRPKWKRPIDKWPRPPKKYGPGPYKPGEKRKYQPAAKGGRIGLQDGKRVDVPPSSQWKKATDKNLKRSQAEAASEQYKDRPKKLKFRC
jgi:hypothetical protein